MFNIYADDREFEVRKATQKAIEQVCMVMCQRKDLKDVERYHYADIAGFEMQEDKQGNKYIEFDLKYTRSDYYNPLAEALFGEKVDGDLDRAEVHRALNFFFNSFGELSHNVLRFWQSLTVAQTLPTLESMIKDLKDGVKDTDGG